MQLCSHGAPLPCAVQPIICLQRATYSPLSKRHRSCKPGLLGLGLTLRKGCYLSNSHSTAHTRCSAAAIPLPPQVESQSNIHPLQAAISNSTAGNVGKPLEAIATSSTSAAVAAKFPAVPLLPTPPRSGDLRDVVPYLLRLALQERHLAWRMAAAISCMVVGKLAGISLPLAFKSAVDALSAASSTTVMVHAALMAVLAYGALDCVRVMAKEAQSPIFAPVSQAVTRRVAYHTFAHVLNLDTRFHIDRRTGRVSRILERGTRSIAVLYRAVIFTFLPTGLELGAVAALLASRFGPLLAAILGVTFAAYVTWTVLMTQIATDVRKEVNHLDNQASSKAVDALLNFETVTLFNNQRLEVGLYDKLLRDLRAASLRAETLAASLNAGQGLILAGGMASILAAIISSGNATGGDLVMASGLIVQLWAPLQFLGWFYRELRAALVDMEEFFQILRTSSNINDGDNTLPLAGPGSAAPHAQAPPRGPPSAATNNSSSGNEAATTCGEGLQTERLASNSSSSSSSSSSDDGRQLGQSCPGGLSVELVNVSFGYSAERQILQGVSLRVAPGESVAVVGSSGSGKSTILKLVTRLYDVWLDPDPHSAAVAEGGAPTGTGTDDNGGCESSSSASLSTSCSTSNNSSSSNTDGGSQRRVEESDKTLACSGNIHSTSSNSRSSSSGGVCRTSSSSSTRSSKRTSGIYINGVDVRQLRLADLRSAIAVVPQDTALYYDTIRENIRYGRPEASDEDVEAAARMARLHDTVIALPDKYDTVVGERGLKLSGGEKQRVAIARAFLRSPRLLICDEATSALDSGTEVAIMDSLKELARGRSAIFVAHRLSTVRNCDRIVVLRSGVVVEEGSHEQLMARRGEYAAMWELQANQQVTALAPGEDDGGITDSDVELSDTEDLEPDQEVREGATRGAAATDSMDDIGAGGAAAGRAATSVLTAAAVPVASTAAAPGPSAATAAVRGAIKDS
ncbi:hypothetical protein Vretimale_19621 [Volvox reticuliferus]|uniref:Uncharacterized protein n=1 Tax=Volvox reticuliferus TaxID=1737510 RepID=A0A8J4GZR1_9CHLO|nr:hypothetical protein Vretifemale_16677 [Volvox reticuliferus]GIM17081.1 hypothetical protein Vretimale_19621 [Volvox reticuliferus]